MEQAVEQPIEQPVEEEPVQETVEADNEEEEKQKQLEAEIGWQRTNRKGKKLPNLNVKTHADWDREKELHVARRLEAERLPERKSQRANFSSLTEIKIKRF